VSGRGLYGTEKKAARTISRKKLAAVGITAIILIGVLFVYNYGFPAASFHFELKYPESAVRGTASVSISNLYDCVLNVSFVDDPDLVYKMDVKLSKPAFAADAFKLTVNKYWQSGSVSVIFSGAIIRTTATPVLVDEVQLILGTATPYYIGVRGENVNSSITFSNNMRGSGSWLVYLATGPSLTLQFTEDMVFSGEEMEISVGTGSPDKPDNIYLSLDLPDGVNGIASFSKPLYIHANSGWTLDSQLPSSATYVTANNDQQPRIGLTLSAMDSVHVWLSD
jgi:hypothetical protein